MNLPGSIWNILYRTCVRFTGRALARVVLLGCLLPGLSSATVFFDSIQFGESVVDPFGYAIGDLNNVYNQPAQRFVSDATGSVNKISFFANANKPTPIDFFVRLWSDSGNSPGTLLEELTAQGIGSGLAEHSVLSSNHPFLITGVTYWLSLSTTTTTIGQLPNESGMWRWSNSPFLGGNTIAVAFDSTSNPIVLPGFPGPWGQDPRDFQAAMLKIEGVVPEPETYTMLLAGLGLLGIIARRRKQQANNRGQTPIVLR